MKYENTVINEIAENIKKVIIGKDEVIDLIITALLCEGHVLIEDVPGVGKTSLASALAHSINCSFKRIQFTPDILPSDITGFSIYNQKTMEFEYKEGLCMSNLILADEINRTSPKTQASLLEVMEEYQITVDNKTFNLPRPFMVLATQNPVNYIGTYPLPEAQIDRFFMKISLGYPSIDDEVEILMRHRKENPLATLKSVASGEDIMQLQSEVDRVIADESIAGYITRIVKATREHEDIILGVSPRGSLALLRAACGNAFIYNRDYVIPDDVKKMALPVLSHRLVLTQDAKLRKVKPETLISIILDKVHVFEKKKNEIKV